MFFPLKNEFSFASFTTLFFLAAFKSYTKQLTFSKIYMKIFFKVLFHSFYKFLFLMRVRDSTSDTGYGCKNVTALLSNYVNLQLWFFISSSIYILGTLETIFAGIIRSKLQAEVNDPNL